MRYTSQHKAETHERIVKKAAQEFRSRGLQGIGIAELMSRLGLTHGGFYAHFKGKNALVAEAAVCGLQASIQKMIAAVESAPQDKGLQAILDYYLSPAHRDNPAQGCVLPALASEIARRPGMVRSAFTNALEDCIKQLARFMPGATIEARRRETMVFLSGIAGAMLLARAINDPELSDEVLRGTREFYSERFGWPMKSAD